MHVVRTEVEGRVRAVAGRAIRIRGTDARRVIRTRREIDVIVTGAAGTRVHRQPPVRCFRRVCIALLVAGLAIAQVLRELDVAEVVHGAAVTHDGVAVREMRAGMDLVDQHLHVDRVAGLGITGIRIVAGHAVLHVGARPTVERQVVVARVAGVVVDDLAARLRERLARRRTEGERRVRHAQRVRLRIIADLDPDPVRKGRIVRQARDRRDVRLERVRIVAATEVGEHARGRGFRGGLVLRLGARQRARPRIDRRARVALPGARGTVRARCEPRDHEAGVGRSKARQRAIEFIQHLELDHRLASGRHRHLRDRRDDAAVLVARNRQRRRRATRTRRTRRPRRTLRTRWPGRARRSVVPLAARDSECSQRHQRNEWHTRSRDAPGAFEFHC